MGSKLGNRFFSKEFRLCCCWGGEITTAAEAVVVVVVVVAAATATLGFSNSADNLRTMLLDLSMAGEEELEDVDVASLSHFLLFEDAAGNEAGGLLLLPRWSRLCWPLKENRLTSKSGLGLGDNRGGLLQLLLLSEIVMRRFEVRVNELANWKSHKKTHAQLIWNRKWTTNISLREFSRETLTSRCCGTKKSSLKYCVRKKIPFCFH